MKYSAPVMGTGKKKIAVGMSGGVDSSITAYLLKQQGHEVVGIMMAIWAGDPSWKVPDGNACYNPNEGQEVKEASAFAEKIGIPFHVFDLKKEYQKTVLDRFVSGYLEGQTPNPCVICNHQMKFGSLFEAAQKNLDFDCFATGHYVQVQQAENGGRHLLKKGIDAKKDQSYFLYRLKQEQLAKTLCPLGGYEKKEVWKISDELGLKFHGESQDFIAGKDYSVLFKTGKEPGPILDATGKEIGQHNGIIHYTIGQRKGLNTLSNERLYVSAIEPQTNTIRVDLKEKLFFADVWVNDLNWISIPRLDKEMQVTVKLRSAHTGAPAMLYPEEESVRIKFDEPQFAPSPGQSAVFYDDAIVVGGGIII